MSKGFGQACIPELGMRGILDQLHEDIYADQKAYPTFLVKFDIKNGFSYSFPFQKCILLYTSKLL